MKVKHLSLATTGSLLLAGAASAAFTGVEVAQFDDFFANDHPSANVRGAWSSFNADNPLDVYRVYATFDAADRVISTFGAGGVGQEMYMNNVTTGAFWNHIDTGHHGDTHYNTAPSGPQIGANPQHAFDTFATIGLFVNDDETTNTSGMFPDNIQSNWTTDDATGGTGGWFSFDPTAPQTEALLGSASQGLQDDGVWRVLLFQFTVKQGDKVEGQFGITTESQGNIYNDSTFFSTNPVPAPGALALLGLAGLAGARRRRK